LVNTDINRAADLYHKIMAEISRVVIGKNEVKEALMLALLAGGHLLIEGSPGTAKTTISKSFAEAIGGTFNRVQFTPDMMPVDITGFYIYSPERPATFIEGPLFANVVLADEINRTTPRTQSALLEAMQEQQITVERKTFKLARPFMVIATQVQAGGEGTYPLTDVQIDRFLLRVDSLYPSQEEEKQVLANIDRIDTPDIQVVATIDDIITVQDVVKSIQVSPQIVDYIVMLIHTLRADPDVLAGPSPRSGIALYKCARVQALMDSRDFVIPDDIKHLAHLALEHRIRLRSEVEMDEITPGIVLERALNKVPVPKIEL
jgi:MoxR-like ATPase